MQGESAEAAAVGKRQKLEQALPQVVQSFLAREVSATPS